MKLLLSISFVAIAHWLNAQNQKTFTEFDSSFVKTPLSISYYGNMMFNPGIKTGFDFFLLSVSKEKVKRKKTKELKKILFLQPSLSYFIDPHSISSTQLNAEMGWKRINKHRFWEAGLTAGYVRRFNLGTTYIANETGDIVSTKKGTSRGYLSTGLVLGCGRKIIKDNSLYGKFNLNALHNYNSGAILEINIEIGLRIPLSISWMNQNVKTIQK